MKAMNSLSTLLTPSSEPTVAASAQGMPINQAIGAKIQPAMRSSVTASPPTIGRKPTTLLASATKAVSTIRMAMMLR